MSDLEPRVAAASLLRQLGHEFSAHDLDDDTLATISNEVSQLLALVSRQPDRSRALRHEGWDFRDAVPQWGVGSPTQLTHDSFTTGWSNPMGLGAYLWRDGDDAVIEVTFGRAFEGAPDRAHGGIVAALLDEAIGIAMNIRGLMAFTAQLDINYRAPTPINEPVVARGSLERRDGRKLYLRGTLTAQDVLVAEASALFIEIDWERFRASAQSPVL